MKRTVGSRRRSTSLSLKLPRFLPQALGLLWSSLLADLDLSEFSVYNEVVDGKNMPPT